MMNPNAAVVLGFDAVTRCLCGGYVRAIEHAEKALHLSPLEPLVYHAEFALALARLLTGRAEEAVAHARHAIEGNRNFAFPYCVLALGCARLGRADEAAQAVRRLARAAPGFHLGSLRRHPVCRRRPSPSRSRPAARGPSAGMTAMPAAADISLRA